MKYAIIIPDGAADEPLDDLEGLTPLQAAATPHMDWIATTGRLGTVSNIPENLPAGSDVAILSVLGYDPTTCYTGRAPLEAAARDIPVTEKDWILRCNLVTIVDGVMQDYCAGHISTEEATAIIAMLQDTLEPTGVHLYPGVGYRHIATIHGELDVQTTPPHDILGQAIEKHLPRGDGSEILQAVMDRAHGMLAGHEINAVRHDLGEAPATDVWLWGQGKMPTLESFADRFGLRGAAITAVDLVRGISRLIGWDLIEVDGATGYVDTNYAGKGQAALSALDDHDLVLVHIEAPDEAGHNADLAGKVRAIKNIDEHIVGPILERFRASEEPWRIVVLPDHPTPISVRTHTRQPVPFALAGHRVEQVCGGLFCEDEAQRADLHIDRGCDLMEFFLTVR
jgi:2,3-bisphosphoglycerate-independent phosphoglycerate mutase